ncbi:MAG: 16S rRNA (cytidine(1402)-2'-O)-methyltransferase [Defluviitaleaceae bacterium]|nr:16S rRNA (cytidine(1402)-2'-O)-methyltransferase [Defluviitaleaceae bacterium]MCL2836084.1 16S rRNA (cytidine(1402)-2'-O)-methyltransferase [Defluviitaleaceae bacterium]
MKQEATKGKLYIVATPIGNLGDMTQRAAEVLAAVNFIAAEDTRVTRILLDRFDIRTPMVACHKFNETGSAERIIQRIMEGQSCALVTDAGTPGISDPGAVLAEIAAAAGIEITAVPGACAVTAALSVCGFKGLSYTFLGFLPKGTAARKALAEALKTSPEILVFYESPHRIIQTAELLNDIGGINRLCICNDLTKKFEHIYRGTPDEVLMRLKSNPNASKGEYTVVAEKALPGITVNETDGTDLISTEARLVDICVKSSVTPKDAAALLYERNGGTLAKKEIYNAALNLKNLFAKPR